MIVTVAIPTLGRPSLAQTLKSLDRQVLPDDLSMRVVLVDDSGESRVSALLAGLSLSLDMKIVDAQGGNVAAARNACLDHAEGAYILFIDDDEIAPPNWVADLVAQALQHDVDCGFGPVTPVYRPDAPRWLTRLNPLYGEQTTTGDHSGEIMGRTGNSIVRLAFLARHKLRFDPRHAEIGEDTAFFGACRRAGAKQQVFGSPAVEERVRDEHHRLGFVLRTQFKRGFAYAGARIHAARQPMLARAHLIGRSVAGMSVGGLGLPLAVVAGETFGVRMLLRIALDAGKFSQTLTQVDGQTVNSSP